MAGQIIALSALDASQYDFIDFGAANGNSLRWAADLFGGRGLGVDISEQRIQSLTERGGDGVVADVTQLDLPEGAVRYTILANILEFLPDTKAALNVLAQAIKVSRDFVLVTGPNFEKEKWLRSQGYKRYFSDWSGRISMPRISDFQDMMTDMNVAQYAIWEVDQIVDSNSWVLVPADTPKNSPSYDPAVHGQKPYQKFDDKLYRGLNVAVFKSPDINPYEIMLKASSIRVRKMPVQDENLVSSVRKPVEAASARRRRR